MSQNNENEVFTTTSKVLNQIDLNQQTLNADIDDGSGLANIFPIPSNKPRISVKNPRRSSILKANVEEYQIERRSSRRVSWASTLQYKKLLPDGTTVVASQELNKIGPCSDANKIPMTAPCSQGVIESKVNSDGQSSSPDPTEQQNVLEEVKKKFDPERLPKVLLKFYNPKESSKDYETVMNTALNKYATEQICNQQKPDLSIYFPGPLHSTTIFSSLDAEQTNEFIFDQSPIKPVDMDLDDDNDNQPQKQQQEETVQTNYETSLMSVSSKNSNDPKIQKIAQNFVSKLQQQQPQTKNCEDVDLSMELSLELPQAVNPAVANASASSPSLEIELSDHSDYPTNVLSNLDQQQQANDGPSIEFPRNKSITELKASIKTSLKITTTKRPSPDKLVDSDIASKNRKLNSFPFTLENDTVCQQEKQQINVSELFTEMAKNNDEIFVEKTDLTKSEKMNSFQFTLENGTKCQQMESTKLPGVGATKNDLTTFDISLDISSDNVGEIAYQEKNNSLKNPINFLEGLKNQTNEEIVSEKTDLSKSENLNLLQFTLGNGTEDKSEKPQFELSKQPAKTDKHDVTTFDISLDIDSDNDEIVYKENNSLKNPKNFLAGLKNPTNDEIVPENSDVPKSEKLNSLQFTLGYNTEDQSEKPQFEFPKEQVEMAKHDVTTFDISLGNTDEIVSENKKLGLPENKKLNSFQITLGNGTEDQEKSQMESSKEQVGMAKNNVTTFDISLDQDQPEKEKQINLSKPSLEMTKNDLAFNMSLRSDNPYEIVAPVKNDSSSKSPNDFSKGLEKQNDEKEKSSKSMKIPLESTVMMNDVSKFTIPLTEALTMEHDKTDITKVSTDSIESIKNSSNINDNNKNKIQQEMSAHFLPLWGDNGRFELLSFSSLKPKTTDKAKAPSSSSKAVPTAVNSSFKVSLSTINTLKTRASIIKPKVDIIKPTPIEPVNVQADDSIDNNSLSLICGGGNNHLKNHIRKSLGYNLKEKLLEIQRIHNQQQHQEKIESNIPTEVVSEVEKPPQIQEDKSEFMVNEQVEVEKNKEKPEDIEMEVSISKLDNNNDDDDEEFGPETIGVEEEQLERVLSPIEMEPTMVELLTSGSKLDHMNEDSENSILQHSKRDDDDDDDEICLEDYLPPDMTINITGNFSAYLDELLPNQIDNVEYSISPFSNDYKTFDDTIIKDVLAESGSMFDFIPQMDFQRLNVRVQSINRNLLVLRYLFSTLELRIHFGSQIKPLQNRRISQEYYSTEVREIIAMDLVSLLDSNRPLPTEVMLGTQDKPLFNGDRFLLQFRDIPEHRHLLTMAQDYVVTHFEEKRDQFQKTFNDTTKLERLIEEFSILVRPAKKMCTELRCLLSEHFVEILPRDSDGRYQISVTLLGMRLDSEFDLLIAFDHLNYPDEVIHPKLIIPEQDKHLYPVEQFLAALKIIKPCKYDYISRLIYGAQMYIRATRAVLKDEKRRRIQSENIKSAKFEPSPQLQQPPINKEQQQSLRSCWSHSHSQIIKFINDFNISRNSVIDKKRKST